jgi:hypothetical protein
MILFYFHHVLRALYFIFNVLVFIFLYLIFYDNNLFDNLIECFLLEINHMQNVYYYHSLQSRSNNSLLSL